MTAQRDDAVDRFRELILYLARLSESDLSFGGTKLNKLLFFCDVYALRKLHQPITNQRYQKLEYGPAPRGLMPAVEAMEEKGDCTFVTRDVFGNTQKRLIARREAQLAAFSAEEIDLVHRVVDDLAQLSARQVSDLSHELLGWQFAAFGEDIPLETTLLGRPVEATEEEIAFGQQLVQDLATH